MARQLTILLALAAASGCATVQIQSKAEWLCKHDQLERPTLALLEPKVDLSEYVAPEDLDDYRHPERMGIGAPAIALAKSAFGAMGAYAEPIIEAKAEATRCEVGDVELDSDRAQVAVKRFEPQVKADLIDWLAFGKLETRDQRLERARSFMAPPEAGARPSEAVLRFVHTDAGWRATWREPAKK